MSLSGSSTIEFLDWNKLAAHYRAAPLGNKNADDLEVAFSTRRFACLARADGKLLAVGRALAANIAQGVAQAKSRHYTLNFAFFSVRQMRRLFFVRGLIFEEVMKRITLLLIAAFGLVSAASAQMPKLDSTPGKWAYSTRTEIPGMGSIPMSFEQCVTQKDIDEGRNLSAQKDAGMDCKYSNLKQTGSRYQFTATCVSKDMPEPMVMTYDMTASPTQFDSKMTMTGGNTKAMGGKMNMSTSAKRTGGC